LRFAAVVDFVVVVVLDMDCVIRCMCGLLMQRAVIDDGWKSLVVVAVMLVAFNLLAFAAILIAFIILVMVVSSD